MFLKLYQNYICILTAAAHKTKIALQLSISVPWRIANRSTISRTWSDFPTMRQKFWINREGKKKTREDCVAKGMGCLCKNTCRKFVIVPVTQRMILNFSGHFSTLFKNAVFNKRKQKFAISSCRVMAYTQKSVECSSSASVFQG